MHQGSPPRPPPVDGPSGARRALQRASPSTPTRPRPSAEFSARPQATFTTCLDILVEGALALDKPEQAASASRRDGLLPPTSEPKRAPRKSKTEAMAALNAHNHDQDDMEGARIKLREGPPIRVSAELDMSSVKTPNPRNMPSKPKERPFGLTDCPTFRPTPEQFKDPMAYIKSISENAKSYGMCKIIPPLGWSMPFVTDTETFRFKTRLQRLNSIEASSRAKVNFLEQLYRFHKQQGNPRVSVPTINYKPLDLWLLRKEVHKLGGYDAVTRTKKWADLGRLLGYGGIPGLATQIKNSYARVILPYEHFCDRVKNSPNMSPNRFHDPTLKTHINIQSAGKASRQNGGDESMPSSPLTDSDSELSSVPDEPDHRNDSVRLRRSTRQASHDPSLPSRRPPTPSANGTDLKDRRSPSEPHCEVCQKKDRGEEMLLCDGCDCGFHIFCLDPALSTIPKGQWFCHVCLFGTGGDFGFDEGEEHSLASFQARDLEFRKLWFTAHPPSDAGGDRERIYDGDLSMRNNAPDPTINKFGDVVVSETDVEREFWRLVQSPNETVEVEYGADVHSTTHGSAMPTLETHPLNQYSKDPWNLNNIPILPESLLRFIKSDISGMTVPWTYVGMIFSTFCWHNEDHYTYSINYMHWGETKTWYSVPGEDADKFEAAIRREAPDLFEAQPDLLFQLVTLMNPQRVKEAGVEVYSCNQRAGEFVITFPKAYHAGFNHGLNFNEAVNFALPDWLPYGLDCVKRYQEHRKLPVFSHDELIITITQQSSSIKTAIWLNESLQEMVDRELEARTRARKMEMEEILEEADRPEEQSQCTVCKVFCYLSQITCSCTTKVVCIDHVDKLCKCAPTKRVLRKRFDDTGLLDTQMKVTERANVPFSWRGKLDRLLTETARPPLKSLRNLLLEGDRISFPLRELHSLRKCVVRANEWVDQAATFLVRKTPRKRPARRVRGRVPGAEGAVIEDVEKPDHSMRDLYALVREVEDLGFDCQEIAALRQLASDAEETQAKARELLQAASSLKDRDAYIQECERLIAHGTTLNVQVDELTEVEKIVMREQLLKELDEETNYEQLTLEDVRQLFSRAHMCGLSLDSKYMKLLEMRLKAGEVWEGRAKAVLEKGQRTLEELEDAAVVPPGVPIDPHVLDTLMTLRTRGKEIEKQLTIWLHPDPSSIKPRPSDVMKLVQRGEKEYNLQAVKEMRRTVDFAVDLENRCDSVLKNRYQHNEDSDIFLAMRQWRTYAKDHLTMFTLPNFDRLEKQLTLHFRWLEGLPWYCRSHHAAHGKPLLDDVVAATRPEDDLPPTDEYFTCICTNPVRPPAPGTISDAVQCDHCFARFHGLCAANGGSCPFCDHQHWNGTLHKDRSYHFVYLPNLLLHAPEITKNYSEDWKQLEIIIHRVDRLCSVIGQFLAYATQPPNQRPDYIPQVRHYMRKLYRIQFAVSPSPENSYGLELAGLHRVLAGQPAPLRQKKRRRPKFIFGQDVDKDWIDGTRCICRGRTNYLLNYPTVECELCGKLYHGGCVFFPIDPTPGGNNRFMCPLCCIRKNRTYPYSEVRVRHVDNNEPDMYVDTKQMLDTFSKDIIYMKLHPPYTQTLFVELMRFTPGQPESAPVNGSGSGATTPHPSGSIPPPSSGRPPLSNGALPHSRAGPLPILAPPHGPMPHGLPSHGPPSHGSPSHGPHSSGPGPSSPASPYEHQRTPIAGPSAPSVLPPPPWSSRSSSSRWSDAAATAPPPSARPHPSDMVSPIEASPMSRKRKQPDEAGPSDELPLPKPPSGPSPKRRSIHSPTTHVHIPPMNHGPMPPMQPMQPPPGLPAMHSPAQQVPLMEIPRQIIPQQMGIALPPMQPGPAPPLRTPPMQTARTSQGLSPSLAMMLSPPSDRDVVLSPPRPQGPPQPAHINPWQGPPPPVQLPGDPYRRMSDPHSPISRRHVDRYPPRGPQSPSVPRQLPTAPRR